MKTRLLVAFAVLVGFADGQTGLLAHPDWQVKPVFSQGFILVHRISIGHLVKGYPAIYELNISKPTVGNTLWQLENNKPDIGLSLQYMDFRNPAQLGYAISAAPYVEIPLNVREIASRPVLRLAFGGTYITKDFDIRTNHKNVAIGSHVNAYVQFRLFWQLQLSRLLRFEPGISFTHASNGRYRNPNLGLNVASLSAGLNLRIPTGRPMPDRSRIDSSSRVSSRNELLAIAAVGFNERKMHDRETESYLLSLAYQRNVRNTHKFSAGADLFVDQVYALDYRQETGSELNGLDACRVSLRGGYSYNVGRISFPIEIGYYVFQKFNPDAVITSRIGVRYYSPSGIVAHFGLRTHFAVAYNFEFGVGYRLPFK